MNKTILVVAAHTDDEALGCGGTIARHVAQGDTVHAVFLADGVTSRPNVGTNENELRMAAARRAHEILGLEHVEYLGLPDNRLDNLPLLDVVQRLEPIICEVVPDVIYSHHQDDLNIDHCITQRAVMTACRPIPGTSVKEIYSFEILSSTDWANQQLAPFIPNVFVDISDYLDIKLRAIRAYELEMRDAPHSRSIEHVEQLAKHRGSSVGLSAAEGFVGLRIIH